MTKYLHTGNAIDPVTKQKQQQPWEYIEMRLCRDLYHCTPSELAEQDWQTVQMHLALWNLEQEIAAFKSGSG